MHKHSVSPEVSAMDCKSCGSMNLKKFPGEIAVRFPGLRNINKATVCIFPELVICLECGIALFVVPKPELRQLVKGASASYSIVG